MNGPLEGFFLRLSNKKKTDEGVETHLVLLLHLLPGSLHVLPVDLGLSLTETDPAGDVLALVYARLQ